MKPLMSIAQTEKNMAAGHISLCWGYIGMMGKNMETTYDGFIWGLYRDYGKENGIVYWGYIEIMEKNMETTVQGSAFRGKAI